MSLWVRSLYYYSCSVCCILAYAALCSCVLFAQFYLHSFICTVLSAQFYLHSFICTVLSAQFYLHSFICTVLSTQFYLHSFICTVLSAQLPRLERFNAKCTGWFVSVYTSVFFPQNASFVQLALNRSRRGNSADKTRQKKRSYRMRFNCYYESVAFTAAAVVVPAFWWALI